MVELAITFLGTGTSQGVPVIGCQCAVCRSSDPRDKRTRSSVYVRTPECALVVDTGTDFRAQCLREGIGKVDAVLYTHSHADHVMGFDDLRAFSGPGKVMPIYASESTMRDLERVFRFAFDGEHRFPGYIHPEPHIIDAPFSLGDTRITPLPVRHGRAAVNGYLFGRNGRPLIAYLSDCKEVPPATMEAMHGVEHLVIDALRHKPHATHLSVKEALEVIAKVQPRRAWLTHLCHELAHAETERLLPPDVRIAYDGLRIDL